MSNSTATTDVAVKTISTQEVRLERKRSFEFWNVLTDEWFKGEKISGSRSVPRQGRKRSAQHEFAQER